MRTTPNGFSLIELCLTLGIFAIIMPIVVAAWLCFCKLQNTLLHHNIQASELRYIITTLQTEFHDLATHTTSPTLITGTSTDGTAVQISFNSGTLKLKHGNATPLDLNTTLQLTSVTFTNLSPSHIQTHLTGPDIPAQDIIYDLPNTP